MKHYLLGIFFTLFSFLETDSLARTNANLEDITRVIAILSHMASDYGDGAAGIAEEFEEMVAFSKTVQEMLPKNKVAELDEKAGSLVSYVSKNNSAQVLLTINEIKNILYKEYDLINKPDRHLAFMDVSNSYKGNCSLCHGVSGRGDGVAASGLDPKPVSFHEQFMAAAVPSDLFVSISVGIASMPSFSFLPEYERWGLTFYLKAMRHLEDRSGAQKFWDELNSEIKERARGIGADSLLKYSDEQLLSWIGENLDANEMWLPVFRTVLPFEEEFFGEKKNIGSLVSSGVKMALDFLKKSVIEVEAGNTEAAKSEVLGAYLEGFENVEKGLKVMDAGLSHALERKFHELRSYVDDKPVFLSKVESLSKELLAAEKRYTAYIKRDDKKFWGGFLGSLVIILREGLEAFLIISALLALMTKLGSRRSKFIIHTAWMAALAAGGISFYLFNEVLKLSGESQENIEAICTGLSVVLLFYTGFWMLSQSEHKKWLQLIKEKTAQGLGTKKTLMIFFMSFLAVYRESVETILFYRALYAGGESFAAINMGFFGGIFILLGLCLLIQKYQKLFPLRKFFVVSSVFMVFLSVVLAGKTIVEFSSSGVIDLTPLNVPSVELLGIYPSFESLGAQLILIVFGVSSYFLIKRRET